MRTLLTLCVCTLLLWGCGDDRPEPTLKLEKDDTIALIGGNLCSRMSYFGYFETAVYQDYPDLNLRFRNMCDPGNTAGFRPHSSRISPWAFDGADAYNQGVSRPTDSQGRFPTEDQWLDSIDADVVLAFFGYSESFNGKKGLTNFALEIDSFIKHTQAQQYNNTSAPELVLVSPLAFEDQSGREDYDLPDGAEANKNLELYTRAMGDMAADNGVTFIDLYTVSKGWFDAGEKLTTDGISLNAEGYEKLASFLSDQLFGIHPDAVDEQLRADVNDKNYFWLTDFKMPNGVHVYGRRFEPYGPDNYPYEIEKVRQMTRNRDELIWAHLGGERFDLAQRDAETVELPPVETNYALEEPEDVRYLYGEEALASFTTAPGYKIELFASEQDFPELANPAQMNFDNQGRLWVACMPTYHHCKPGDARPDDKLVILEDRQGR